MLHEITYQEAKLLANPCEIIRKAREQKIIKPLCNFRWLISSSRRRRLSSFGKDIIEAYIIVKDKSVILFDLKIKDIPKVVLDYWG